MADNRKSYAERVARWETILNSAEMIEAELPHLVPDLRALAAAAAEAKRLYREKMRAVARSADLTKKLREQLRAEDRLRGQLGASLRGRYGFDSTDLMEALGFKPRSTKIRPNSTVPARDAGAGGGVRSRLPQR
jgi:hypothetical protein